MPRSAGTYTRQAAMFDTAVDVDELALVRAAHGHPFARS
jgi:hypothetical protein